MHVPVPEDVALDFLVADPAMLFLLCYHSPLCRPWYFFLVHQVPREDQFLIKGEEFVLCRTILDDSLKIVQLLDLDRLLYEVSVVFLQRGLTEASLEVEGLSLHYYFSLKDLLRFLLYVLSHSWVAREVDGHESSRFLYTRDHLQQHRLRQIGASQINMN